MTAKGELDVRLIAAGVLAVVAAFAFGLRTPSGGPDWVGIFMGVAGLVIIVAGVVPRFRGGARHAR
jgi:hypothetical protein